MAFEPEIVPPELPVLRGPHEPPHRPKVSLSLNLGRLAADLAPIAPLILDKVFGLTGMWSALAYWAAGSWASWKFLWWAGKQAPARASRWRAFRRWFWRGALSILIGLIAVCTMERILTSVPAPIYQLIGMPYHLVNGEGFAYGVKWDARNYRIERVQMVVPRSSGEVHNAEIYINMPAIVDRARFIPPPKRAADVRFRDPWAMDNQDVQSEIRPGTNLLLVDASTLSPDSELTIELLLDYGSFAQAMECKGEEKCGAVWITYRYESFFGHEREHVDRHDVVDRPLPKELWADQEIPPRSIQLRRLPEEAVSIWLRIAQFLKAPLL